MKFSIRWIPSTSEKPATISIRIDLDGHIDTAEEKRHAAAVGRAENGVHGGLHPVGDHAFFEKTPEDTLESKGEIFI